MVTGSVVFGLGMVLIGALGIFFRRTFGEASARRFKGSGWVGLEKTAAEWTRVQALIGFLFIFGGAAIALVSFVQPFG